jgi:hypothetical protein
MQTTIETDDALLKRAVEGGQSAGSTPEVRPEA